MRTEFKIGLAIGLAVLLIVVVYFGFIQEPSEPVAEGPAADVPEPTIGTVEVARAEPSARPAPALPPGPRLSPFATSDLPPRRAEPADEPADEQEDVVPVIAPGPGTPSPILPPTTAVPPAPARPTPILAPAAVTPAPSGPSRTVTPAPTRTYTVKEGDSLWSIAQEVYGDGSKWPQIQAANTGVDHTRLRAGQTLTIPPQTATPAIVSASPSASSAAGQRTYTVQEGEGYWVIAEKVYGSGKYWTKLQQANRIDSRNLKPGQKIIVPALSSDGGPSPSASPAGSAPTADGKRTYTVQLGDSGFWGVAQKVYGNGAHWQVIAQANPDVDPQNLKPGQELTIPALPAGGASTLPRAPRPASAGDGRPIFD